MAGSGKVSRGSGWRTADVLKNLSIDTLPLLEWLAVTSDGRISDASPGKGPGSWATASWDSRNPVNNSGLHINMSQLFADVIGLALPLGFQVMTALAVLFANAAVRFSLLYEGPESDRFADPNNANTLYSLLAGMVVGVLISIIKTPENWREVTAAAFISIFLAYATEQFAGNMIPSMAGFLAPGLDADNQPSMQYSSVLVGELFGLISRSLAACVQGASFVFAANLFVLSSVVRAMQGTKIRKIPLVGSSNLNDEVRQAEYGRGFRSGESEGQRGATASLKGSAEPQSGVASPSDGGAVDDLWGYGPEPSKLAAGYGTQGGPGQFQPAVRRQGGSEESVLLVPASPTLGGKGDSE